MTVPGIGPRWAARIHEQLGLDSLEGLEQAAHDGSLERLPGFGPHRCRAVRHALEAMLARASPQRSMNLPLSAAPSVEALLEIDARYRSLAARGALPRITPQREREGS